MIDTFKMLTINPDIKSNNEQFGIIYLYFLLSIIHKMHKHYFFSFCSILNLFLRILEKGANLSVIEKFNSKK